jgi:hypothetical protein
MLVLVLAGTSWVGPDDSPSARPGSATSSPRTLTPSQRTKLEFREVINIIASSSPDWKKTPVTGEQDGALRECLVSTLDLSRVVLVAEPPLEAHRSHREGKRHVEPGRILRTTEGAVLRPGSRRRGSRSPDFRSVFVRHQMVPQAGESVVMTALTPTSST